MRVFLAPPALAAVLALAPVAFAAQTTSGSIKSLDMKTHTLTLDNGTTYYLPATFKEQGLKVGEKVSVQWDMKDGKHQAQSVTATK